MRLADFISRNMETILAQWESFAVTLLPAAANMSSPALRDHAQQILEAVVKDLSTSQTNKEQHEKSLGLHPQVTLGSDTAAQTHALLRARSGFEINQMTAEYRALRASVLRLWVDACSPDAPHVNDIMRFNEAIDQALAESVGYFSAQVDQARNLLLGMLGHDMRSPLQAIQMTAVYLTALNAGDKVSDGAARIIHSGARMQALLDDMIDFNRTRLGLGINISIEKVDLARLFAEELDMLRAAHPSCQVDLAVEGNSEGVWDGRRLQQLLGNLVINAIKYGASSAPIRVVITAEDEQVHFEVRNDRLTIDQTVLDQMFEPLRRGTDQESKHDIGGNLGLGLYIAREVAKAHGGDINARSEGGQTVFSVRLPRQQ